MHVVLASSNVFACHSVKLIGSKVIEESEKEFGLVCVWRMYYILSRLIYAMFLHKKCAKSGFLNGRNSSKMLHCTIIDKSIFQEGICFSYCMACWAQCKGDKEARQDFVHC